MKTPSEDYECEDYVVHLQSHSSSQDDKSLFQACSDHIAESASRAQSGSDQSTPYSESRHPQEVLRVFYRG